MKSNINQAGPAPFSLTQQKATRGPNKGKVEFIVKEKDISMSFIKQRIVIVTLMSCIF